MDDRRIQPVIRRLRQKHGRRYAEAAYFFLLEALDYTMCLLGKSRLQGEARHITGPELLDGIRQYAKEEFGPLAPYAFRSWGILNTEDFGALVFQMCEAGLLNKRDSDRLEDFRDGFDFRNAFAEIDSIPA